MQGGAAIGFDEGELFSYLPVGFMAVGKSAEVVCRLHGDGVEDRVDVDFWHRLRPLELSRFGAPSESRNE